MFPVFSAHQAVEFPSNGSVISPDRVTRNDLPPYVCVPPVPNEYANSGYLPTAFGPFALGADPAQGNFQVRDLNLPNGVDAARFALGKSLERDLRGIFDGPSTTRPDRSGRGLALDRPPAHWLPSPLTPRTTAPTAAPQGRPTTPEGHRSPPRCPVTPR